MIAPATPRCPARPSFEGVYAAGLAFLRQALRWLGVAEPDLDDVLQDVFLAAYRGLDGYDPWHHARAQGAGPAPAGPDEALKRWLFGIAWRQVSHYRDRAHRRREVPSGAGVSGPFEGADARPTPEQAAAHADRSRLVAAVLAEIAAPRRIVLILYDLLDLPVADIARDLGVTETTVRNRLRLAREDFRVAVARQSLEKRRALGDLRASERPFSFLGDALLRAARYVPEVPAALRERLWSDFQQRLRRAREAPGAARTAPVCPPP